MLKLLFLIVFLAPSYALAENADSSKNILSIFTKTLESFLFYDISFGSLPVSVPLVVFVLSLGSIFFTFYFGFINIRGFFHAIQVVRGKYDSHGDDGEISHFRALTSALSATVGLGNIGGVAIAIQAGGPGAIFWMFVMAIFGMTSKFLSCTLSQIYRKHNSDYSISGGPMYYLEIGLGEKGKAFALLGHILAVLYAILIIGGCLGAGNMYQANQTAEAIRSGFGVSADYNFLIGVILAFFVGIVILGGVKRIGSATSKIVPFMCGLYVLSGLYIVAVNYESVPSALLTIMTSAFSSDAVVGGFLGVLIIGVKRAAFSNEAGLGSAAIIHAAAKTNEPVREGLVAMLGPFIDTIIVCLTTALVVVITGTYLDPEIASQGTNIGISITSQAFGSVLPWFPYVLVICIILFAYSTMLAWCYYGERGWIYLVHKLGFSGIKSLPIFRLIFISCAVLGTTNSLSDVINFADVLLLGMSFPNIIGALFMAPIVKRELKAYFAKYKADI